MELPFRAILHVGLFIEIYICHSTVLSGGDLEIASLSKIYLSYKHRLRCLYLISFLISFSFELPKENFYTCIVRNKMKYTSQISVLPLLSHHYLLATTADVTIHDVGSQSCLLQTSYYACRCVCLTHFCSSCKALKAFVRGNLTRNSERCPIGSSGLIGTRSEDSGSITLCCCRSLW